MNIFFNLLVLCVTAAAQDNRFHVPISVCQHSLLLNRQNDPNCIRSRAPTVTQTDTRSQRRKYKCCGSTDIHSPVPTSAHVSVHHALRVRMCRRPIRIHWLAPTSAHVNVRRALPLNMYKHPKHNCARVPTATPRKAKR